MIPEILLGGSLLVVVASLADSIWRLWRGRPRPFHAWPDSGLYLLMVFVTLQLPAWETRDLIAKVVLVIAVAALIVVGIIGRKRVPVQS